jgi:hypothetical protein
MAYAKKVDANQKAIVKLGRSLGAKIAITSSAGDGFVDTVWQFTYPYGLRTHLVEIKDPDKPPSQRKLTPKQVIFHSIFECHIVETVKDVFDLLEIPYYD